VLGVSSSDGGVGISGNAFSASGYTTGVVGNSSSPTGSGVFGYDTATTGGNSGVVGQVASPNGTAGVFINVSGQGLLLQGISGSVGTTVFTVDASGNLQINGNLTVSGTKSSTARLQDGREVLLYAVESPENWFEDFGSAELSNGVAWIPLDPSFAQATNASLPYHVFLTPNGDSSGLYVARKTSAGFEVREHGSGTSNVAFDFRIVARRRGYETVRMADVRRPKTAISPRQFRSAQGIKPVKIPFPTRPAAVPIAVRPSIP